MNGNLGKQLRLARLLSGKGGRAACFAFDHGGQLGPIPGTEDARKVIALAVKAGLDGIILTPGMVTRHGDLLAGRDKPCIIYRLDQTSMWRVGAPTGYPSGHTRQMSTVEEAVQLGADAVLTYLFTCHVEPELERHSIELAGKVAEQSRKWGVPYVAEPMAARGGLVADPFTAEVIAMNSRIAAEIGADVIKTDWSGDAKSFSRVVRSAEAPVLVAGGARGGDDAATLETVAQILESGARGVLFGRQIFQSPDPLALMIAIRAMIHDDLPLADAIKRLPGKPRTKTRRA